MNATATANVPRWVMWLFTCLQPVIASALVGGVGLLFQMNNRVTVLSVQMDQVLKTDGKIEALGERITLANERLSRLEGKIERQVGPDPR